MFSVPSSTGLPRPLLESFFCAVDSFPQNIEQRTSNVEVRPLPAIPAFALSERIGSAFRSQ
jgi:hypothetical protein